MSRVDLSSLRMEPAPAVLPPRPFWPRILTAAAILLAFAVALTFVWPWLRPVRAVPTAPVRLAAGSGAGITAIAEAAGWIEPDPFPVIVRPLVAGRVESIAVLEGSAVQGGETVVARLGSAALESQQERAAAALAQQDAALQAAEAVHGLAVAQLTQKAELRRAVAEGQVAVAAREERLAVARGAVGRATAEAAGAAAAMKAQEKLATSGGTYQLALARARAAASAADAGVTAAREALAALEHELAGTRASLAIAEEVLADPVGLLGAVAVAGADREKARAARAAARVEADIAARELQWAEVQAPVDGVVLRLLAMPGSAVGPHGDGILLLYDPKRLRARIDVPLASAGDIAEGQQVELRSEVLGGTVVRGVVQRVQREADLLKNTLQVKVQVIDPPPLLRPETLCRARFLARESTDATSRPLAFSVPKGAVRESTVFVFDPERRCARAVPVQVVHEEGDTAMVRGDLSLTQRVILAPVKDGEAVREESR